MGFLRDNPGEIFILYAGSLRAFVKAMNNAIPHTLFLYPCTLVRRIVLILKYKPEVSYGLFFLQDWFYLNEKNLLKNFDFIGR